MTSNKIISVIVVTVLLLMAAVVAPPALYAKKSHKSSDSGNNSGGSSDKSSGDNNKSDGSKGDSGTNDNSGTDSSSPIVVSEPKKTEPPIPPTTTTSDQIISDLNNINSPAFVATEPDSSSSFSSSSSSSHSSHSKSKVSCKNADLTDISDSKSKKKCSKADDNLNMPGPNNPQVSLLDIRENQTAFSVLWQNRSGFHFAVSVPKNPIPKPTVVDRSTITTKSNTGSFTTKNDDIQTHKGILPAAIVPAPSSAAAAPTDNCRPGQSLNIKAECIPNSCPPGKHRLDNDEIGKKCIPNSTSTTFNVTATRTDRLFEKCWKRELSGIGIDPKLLDDTKEFTKRQILTNNMTLSQEGTSPNTMLTSIRDCIKGVK